MIFYTFTWEANTWAALCCVFVHACVRRCTECQRQQRTNVEGQTQHHMFNSPLHHLSILPGACLPPSSPMPRCPHFPSSPLPTPLTQTPPAQPRSKSPHSLKTLPSKSPLSQPPLSPPPNPSLATELLTRYFHFMTAGPRKTALIMFSDDFKQWSIEMRMHLCACSRLLSYTHCDRVKACAVF